MGLGGCAIATVGAGGVTFFRFFGLISGVTVGLTSVTLLGGGACMGGKLGEGGGGT